jgi:DNA-binding MarR family transcriptional regulator
MVTTLRDEIKQNKPFESLEQEAQLNIIRTGSLLLDDVEQFLKPYGVTATQYNVLRILRGAHPVGLCRNELRDRMLTRMPDVTRLLDRMEEVGMVARSRENEDRRMVRTQITAAGMKILDDVNEAAQQEQKRRFQSLNETQLKTLIELLTVVRQSG